MLADMQTSDIGLRRRRFAQTIAAKTSTHHGPPLAKPASTMISFETDLAPSLDDATQEPALQQSQAHLDDAPFRTPAPALLCSESTTAGNFPGVARDVDTVVLREDERTTPLDQKLHLQEVQQLLTPPSDPADWRTLPLTEAAMSQGGGDSENLTHPAGSVALIEPAPAPDQPVAIDEGGFMTAFSMNFGMPYKFVAEGASKSFEEAPLCIRACRSRLNWAARNFLAPAQDEVGAAEFNEELVFAYMQGQKIDYHDDGEDGLGPRIATLSLGGKAEMRLRMKQKHHTGCSKSGVLTPDRPVGGLEYKLRLDAWQELQKIKDTDPALYRSRLKELPNELKLVERRKQAQDLVTLTLGHGDIVLMDGYEIQQYLEHKVVPEGYLRFALTCRHILASHLKPHEMPAYDVKADAIGYDGSDLL